MVRLGHKLRTAASSLLLLVQALGLGHLALGSHSVDQGGALVEVVQQDAIGPLETHSESAAHFCESTVVHHANDPHACMVIAAWTAPSVATQGTGLAVASQPRLISATKAAVVPMQFEALSRAPKASPPQG